MAYTKIRRVTYVGTVLVQLGVWALVFSGDWGGSAGRIAEFEHNGTTVNAVLLGFHYEDADGGSHLVPWPTERSTEAYTATVCARLGEQTKCPSHDWGTMHMWSNVVLYVMPLSLAACVALLAVLVIGTDEDEGYFSDSTAARLSAVVVFMWVLLLIAVASYMGALDNHSDDFGATITYGWLFYFLAIVDCGLPGGWMLWWIVAYVMDVSAKDYTALPTLAVF